MFKLPWRKKFRERIGKSIYEWLEFHKLPGVKGHMFIIELYLECLKIILKSLMTVNVREKAGKNRNCH